MAVWIMTQMKRWGQVKGDIAWRDVANQVYLATDAAAAMKEAGLTPPDTAYKSYTIMGKTFDPAKARRVRRLLPIKRT